MYYCMYRNKHANERSHLTDRRQKQPSWQDGKGKAERAKGLCTLQQEDRGEVYAARFGSVLAWGMSKMLLLQHPADRSELQVLPQRRFDSLQTRLHQVRAPLSLLLWLDCYQGVLRLLPSRSRAWAITAKTKGEPNGFPSFSRIRALVICPSRATMLRQEGIQRSFIHSCLIGRPAFQHPQGPASLIHKQRKENIIFSW